MRFDRARVLGSRDAWLGARRLGSSDVALVLGRSPYGGPWRVWRRLRGLSVPEHGGPERTQGLRWEPVIRAAYEVETGRRIRVFREGTLFDAPEPWSTSTPDGAVLDGETWGCAELKLAFEPGLDWPPSGPVERWSPEALPRRDWYLQALHQTWATDAPWCDLVVLLPAGHDLRVYRIHRDEALLAGLIPQLRDWYRRHVEEGAPVFPDSPDEILVLADEHHGRGAYRRRPATEKEQALALNLYQSREALKQGRDYVDALQARLYIEAGRASALTFTRDGVRWTVSLVRNPPHVRVHHRSNHGNLGRRALLSLDEGP